MKQRDKLKEQAIKNKPHTLMDRNKVNLLNIKARIEFSADFSL